MRRDLNGQSPVDFSIAVLRNHEPPEGYWLAFSGGKDSVALLALAKASGVRFDAHYNVTTIDPPELVRFIRDEYPEVTFERSPKSFFSRIAEGRGFPGRTTRWCCEEYKEKGGKGRVVLTGIRAEESPRRRKRDVTEGLEERDRQMKGIIDHCDRLPSKAFVNPIFLWTEADVWQYIRENQIPYCPLYHEGWHRLGCVACPFERGIERARARWPKMFTQLERAFVRAYAHPKCGEWRRRWPSGEAVFAWWLRRDAPYPKATDEEPEQTCLFGQGMS